MILIADRKMGKKMQCPFRINNKQMSSKSSIDVSFVIIEIANVWIASCAIEILFYCLLLVVTTTSDGCNSMIERLVHCNITPILFIVTQIFLCFLKWIMCSVSCWNGILYIIYTGISSLKTCSFDIFSK